MENANEMLFSRHLDEVDDLKTYGRDAPLERSPENHEKLEKATEAIYQKIVTSGKKAVLFITSPRVRATETAELIAMGLTQRDPSLKIRFSSNEDLKATEQGEFVLPDDYEQNNFFVGLDIASKIFTKEAHLSDEQGMEDNISYRFGDPIQLPDGSYKYPELVEHFTKTGESYAETLSRIFNSVLEMSGKYDKLMEATEVVIVAHGQIYHVLRGLSEIHRMIKDGEIEFKKGDSMKLIWKIYNDCDPSQKVTGICMPLDFNALNDPAAMSLLEGEREILQGATDSDSHGHRKT